MRATKFRSTGMTDSEGKEVLEGDYVLIPSTMLNTQIIGIIEYKDGHFVARSILSNSIYALTWVFRDRTIGEPRSKIIGNIVDNPNLQYKYHGKKENETDR